MTKSIIMSVSPEEALNILNGKQTALLRKRIPKDYKGWVYGYVKKGKPYLYIFANLDYGISDEIINQQYHISLNQTIPFRFWYDEYETIITKTIYYQTDDGMEEDIMYDISKEQLSKINVSYSAIEEYGNYKEDKNGFIIKTLYLMPIKKLEIFDKPMQLSEFIIDFVDCDTDICGKEVDWYKLPIPLQKPPKTYQYVWVIANIDIGLIDGSFIESLRIKLKLSKKEFSNILGISTFEYVWIETGFEYISHIEKTLFYLLDKQPELLNLLYD